MVTMVTRTMMSVVVVLGLTALLVGFPSASAQIASPQGQNIAPVYEGWEKNADGSFSLLFGYYNRNWAERITLPIGPDNSIEPGGPDYGQPTHFYPRRNRFLFKVRVPADFGDKELVWTLTSNGQTERAYGSLLVDYFTDDTVIMNNKGAGGGAGGLSGRSRLFALCRRLRRRSLWRARPAAHSRRVFHHIFVPKSPLGESDCCCPELNMIRKVPFHCQLSPRVGELENFGKPMENEWEHWKTFGNQEK